MSDEAASHGTDSQPALPLRKRALQWLSKHRDLSVLGLGVLVAGALALAGVARVGWPWLFFLSASIAAIAALATRALQEKEDAERIRSLWAALAVSVALLAAIFGYHEWWDPALASPDRSYSVLVGGGGEDMFYPYDSPDGSQDYAYSPVLSETVIELQCYVSLPASGVWYEIGTDGGWIPRNAVHAVPGLPFPSPPYCSG
jgi:MFS family permease